MTETLTTPDGVPYVRTPEERFAAIDDYSHEPHYVTVDGLRMAYVTAGPDASDGGTATILLLHGEPTWGYLYRKMIPVLAGAGHRVMVPDLIGFGRSDKPVDRAAYTYAGHVEWMREFLEATAAERGDGPLHLFGQDWGGLIGLRLAAENPDLFDRLILANTALPVGDSPGAGFDFWRQFSQDVPFLDCGRLVDNATANELSEAAVEAYRAPFPEETAPGRGPPVPAAGAGLARRPGRARQQSRLGGPGAVDQARADPVGSGRPGAGGPAAVHDGAHPGRGRPAPRPVRAGQPLHPGGPGPGPCRSHQRLARRRLTGRVPRPTTLRGNPMPARFAEKQRVSKGVGRWLKPLAAFEAVVIILVMSLLLSQEKSQFAVGMGRPHRTGRPGRRSPSGDSVDDAAAGAG